MKITFKYEIIPDYRSTGRTAVIGNVGDIYGSYFEPIT